MHFQSAITRSCFILQCFRVRTFQDLQLRSMLIIVYNSDDWGCVHLHPDNIWVWINIYYIIPFLGGWTSIYQLFWCSPGVQGFDTLPFDNCHQSWPCRDRDRDRDRDAAFRCYASTEAAGVVPSPRPSGKVQYSARRSSVRHLVARELLSFHQFNKNTGESGDTRWSWLFLTIFVVLSGGSRCAEGDVALSTDVDSRGFFDVLCPARTQQPARSLKIQKVDTVQVWQRYDKGMTTFDKVLTCL